MKNFLSIPRTSLIALGLVGAGLAGCTQSATHTVTITMPPSQNSTGRHASASVRQSTSAPATFDGFDCFAINITGTGISRDSRSSSFCSSGGTGMGALGGMAPFSGGSVSVSVIAGSSRTIQLLGVMTPDGTCPSIDQLGTYETQVGGPQTFLLGQTTTDIVVDTAVSIQAQYDPTNPISIFADCSTSSSSSPSAGSKLSFSVLPSTTATAGMPFATQPTVQILSATGTLESINDNLTLAAFLNSDCTGPATGFNGSSATASSGIATFSGANETVAGTIYIQARDITHSGVTPACSSAIVTSAGAASTLAFTTQPSSVTTISTTFVTQPVVGFQDSYGNAAPGTATVVLAAYTNSTCISASGGALGGNTQIASAGIATYTSVNESSLGTIFLKATSGGLSSPCSSAVIVNDIPPTSLTYTVPSPTYVKGTAITNNSPSSSGGAVISYSVSPSLPAGLNLNTANGLISGTPTVIVSATSYTVTATNSGGTTTSSLLIIVNDIPPSALTYPQHPSVFLVGTAIQTLTPTNSGGAIVSYTVTPPLPTGLSLNSATGVISGTPASTTGSTSYSVTGLNSGGTNSTVVTIQTSPCSAPASTTQIGPVAASCSGDTAPSGGIIYVSTTGNDGSPDPTVMSTPFATINAAIAYAVSYSKTSPAWEIRVCNGNYNGNPTLIQPISIKGGYNCGTWLRNSGCFDPAQAASQYFASGAPYAPAVTRIISNVDGTAALTISSGNSATIIDGFEIDAYSGAANNQNNAIVVSGAGVKPVISNNHIVGGSSLTTTEVGGFGNQSTAGINIKSAAGPDIRNNYIQGGSGSNNNSGAIVGSAGIYGGAAGDVWIHNNRIEGGSGTLKNSTYGNTVASVGVYFDASGISGMTQALGNPIEFNSIDGGTGTVSGGSGTYATIGIYLFWTGTVSIDMVGNLITGGSGTGGTNGARGIFSGNGGSGTSVTSYIVGNKVYAGDNSIPLPLEAMQLFGAYSTNYIVNNMIHAGNSATTANVSTRVVGISFEVNQVTPTTMSHNTIFAGGSGSVPAFAVSFPNFTTTPSPISMDNNVFAGNNIQSSAIYTNACPSYNLFPNVQNNLFINHDASAMVYGAAVGGTCAASTSYSTISLMVTELAARHAGTYTGNLTMDPTCTADPSNCKLQSACQSNPGNLSAANSCLQYVFTSWNAADNGLTDLKGVSGWNLNACPASYPYFPLCPIVQSSYQDGSSSFPLNNDIFMNSRPAVVQPSRGAVQFGGVCTN